MKYKGKKLEGFNTDILVLMRGNERVIFKAQAVDSDEEFNKLVSIPVPPEILRPGGVREKDINDSKYKKASAEYAQLKTDWLILNSLKATSDLEWEQIDYNKPSTWINWQSELREAGFTDTECMRIVQLVAQVNSLDDDMLEQARLDFLREASQEKELFSQKDEHPCM